MHDYSIDNHPKEKVIFILAFIAIASAPLLNVVIAKAFSLGGLKLASVTTIPVFAFFTAIYWLMNKHVWKVKIFRTMLLVPDLNGEWKCSGLTKQKNGQPAQIEWESVITITQSWSKILIYSKTDTSSSKSIAASIFYAPGEGYKLLYQYKNEPNLNNPELRNHTGYAEICFSEALDSGAGFYFTDQHRSTVGTTKLNRQ